MPSYDHIVVGGGISGMTTAMLLAKDGAQVAIIESFPLLAPTVRGFRRKGVLFDTGLHYVGGLGDGHPLDVYFKHLGISNHIRKKAYNPCGFDRFLFEKKALSYDIPCGFDKLTSTFTKWFPNEGKSIERYFTAIQQTLDASPFLNFSMDFDLGSAIHSDTTTLEDFLAGITENEELKTLLCYQNLLYGVPPTEALLITHALVAGSYYMSAHTIEGGGNALVKAYEKRLKELNVECFCGNRVESILINDAKEVEGVTLNTGKNLSTRSCIWTAHPHGLIKATPDSAFRPAFKKRLAILEDTTSALMLFGICEEPIESLNGRNIFLWPGGSFDDNLNGRSNQNESIIYLSSTYDKKSKKTAITAITPQPYGPYAQWKDSKRGNRPPEYVEHKKNVLETFKQEIFRRAPELQGSIEFIDGATPLTLKDYCATPTGSLYGLKHSVNQFNPAPITKVSGLTIAGQGIVAPGILGAIVSAYLTCGILIGHDHLHKELRQHA
ncbi:MAG: NAD(P)/FAD-dependent oxidoreductase [Pseudodesulfovibrio sp.]|nr:NAD(P)/FAD-dependent oxidoreductase [Pseudodesulfovibrio sp.]